MSRLKYQLCFKIVIDKQVVIITENTTNDRLFVIFYESKQNHFLNNWLYFNN